MLIKMSIWRGRLSTSFSREMSFMTLSTEDLTGNSFLMVMENKEKMLFLREH